MKVLVPVKRAIDYNVRVRIDAAGTGVETAGVKMSLNPFDETAAEEAVRMRETGAASEAVAVSVGPAATEETLRTVLAMGADRAILVKTDAALEPAAVAKVLKRICELEAPDLVLCGRQAIDDDAGQVGPMLAGMLGWAQGVGGSKLDIDGGAATVRCEVETGVWHLRLKLPAVVSVDLRLNTPRYVTLPAIMRAKKKPLDVLPLSDLGLDTEARATRTALREPPARTPGPRLTDVDAFADRLRQAMETV